LLGHQHLVGERIIDPTCDRLAVLDPGDDDAEAGCAARKIGGAVDGIDDPDRGRFAQQLEPRRIFMRREPGAASVSRSVSARSTARSATVTKSPGFFSRMSSCANMRKRGTISICAISRMAAAILSGWVIVRTGDIPSE
jgi:hypothetical protein